jgi:uncharacterized membrane protein YdjX (TVP38/TMEM64 family)
VSQARGLVLRVAAVLLLVAAAAGARWALGAGWLQTLSAWARGGAPWVPAVFVISYALGVCLLVPGSIMTVLGAALFGPLTGFAWVWLGAALGAAGAFGVSRWLGRAAVTRVFGSRFLAWEPFLQQRGLVIVAVARLAWLPFTPSSFAFGLTPVRFRDYLWGTAIGMTPGTFAFTWLVGSATDHVQGSQTLTIEFLVPGLVVLSLAAAGVVAARRLLPPAGVPQPPKT